jgi:hypothetical protein
LKSCERAARNFPHARVHASSRIPTASRPGSGVRSLYLGVITGQVGGVTVDGVVPAPVPGVGEQLPGAGTVEGVVPRVVPFGPAVAGAGAVVPPGSELEPSGVWLEFGIVVVGEVAVWLALGIGVVCACAAPNARTKAAVVRMVFMVLSPCWRENVCGAVPVPEVPGAARGNNTSVIRRASS